MFITNRIIKALFKPTGRGRGNVPTAIFPSVEVKLTSEKSDSREFKADKSGQVSLGLASREQENWPIERHAWVAETRLLTQLEDQGISLGRISVQELDLTDQELNELRIFNISTVQELVNCAKNGFLDIPNLAMPSVEEIRKKLTSYLAKMSGRSDWESNTAEMHKQMIQSSLLEDIENQKATDSTFGEQENWPIEQYGRIVDASLLTQLEDRGIQLNKIGVEVLSLPPRISTVLKRANIHTIKQLSNCTETDFLGMYHIGVSRVEGIKKRLNSFLAEVLLKSNKEEQARTEVGYLSEKLLHLASHLCSVFEDQELLYDLNLPPKVQETLHKATGERLETLAELKRLIKLHSSEPRFLDRDEEIFAKIHALDQSIWWLDKMLTSGSIDDEVNDLAGRLSDKERFVLISRFRLEQQLTLEALGHQLGVTRERVRQIEAKARKLLVAQMSRSTLFYSTSGIILLKRLGQDATVELWKQQLMNIGFLKEESSADLLLEIGRATKSSLLSLSEEFYQMLETHISPRILSARKSARKPVLDKARKSCRNCGAIRVVSLISEKVSEADVEQILCSDGFTEVHPGWWIKEAGECVPERIARKVITYCGSVSPSNMRQALGRHLSRSGFPAPPSEVLVEVLEKTGEFTLADGFLQFSKIPARKPILTKPESIFVRLAHSEGPVISFESIRANVIDEGFSAASVPPLLSHSPIVEKVAFGLYILLGTQYDVGDVERAKSELVRVPANASMKPRSDGIIEFETNIGTWMIYGGVLRCGPASSMEGTWTRIVDGVDNGELVIGGGFVRGFSEVVENLDLIPGDRIRIEFNTWTREATITKVVNNEQIC